MSADVVVVGSFMLDLVVRAPRFAGPGETVLGSDVAEHLGGKGFNQALAAARAGASTAMVGAIGSDRFGSSFLELMEQEQIDRLHVRVDPNSGTGMGFPVVVPGGENSIIVVPRANSTFSCDDVAQAERLIAGSRVLLVQLELPLEPLALATKIARRNGVSVILNAAPAADSVAEFAVDHLVVNLSEAHHLLGVAGLTPVDVAVRLRELHRLDSVVVTLGADGSVVADREGVFIIPALKVETLDTVGAGDAYCGYLAAGLAAGESVREAAQRANVAGALATTISGAAPSIPRRVQVLDAASAASGRR